MTDMVAPPSHLARGMFPMWPINRFFAGFAQTGGKVESMLRAAGVEPGGDAPFDDEMAAADLLRLLQRTMRLTRDELWGLRPQATRPGTFLQACRLAVQAGTVEQGLRAAFRFYHGVADDFTLRLAREGGEARITLIDALPQRPGRDLLHVVLLQALRATIEWLSGRIGVIECVQFQYPHRQHVEALQSLFGAAIVRTAPRTGLLLNQAVLARRIAADPSQVRDFVASMPGQLVLVVQDRRSVADRAASYIRAQANWNVGREDVAEALNMSEATFDRRLHEDIGVGFQELKDRLRCAAALALMAVDGVSLEQVACTLGFSELSSFHRAFKRWTGQGPGSYRRCAWQADGHCRTH